MEILKPQIQSLPKPHFSSPLNFSFSTSFPLKTQTSNPRLLHRTPFCFRSNQSLKISSKLGQRRNSLRKKISEQQLNQKVRPLNDSQNLIEGFFNLNVRSNVEKVTPLDETEVWGDGSGPIFTVYTDLDGNIKNVCVNEDEILRRSGVQPLSARNDDDKLDQDLLDVNLKMSRAKCVAKEIENGEYVVPKDSGIARFVVQSQFSEGVRAVSALLPIKLVKFYPNVFAVFGGCLFLYWIAKVFGSRNGVAMTEEEKEMLRRKIKARVEREAEEKMEIGNVEVVAARVSEPIVTEIERPKLDKQELMNNILKAKGDNKPALLESAGSSVAANSRVFDDKVKEIIEMARKAREIERQEKSGLDGNDEDENEELANKEGKKISGDEPGSLESSGSVAAKSRDFDDKVSEAKEVGRQEKFGVDENEELANKEGKKISGDKPGLLDSSGSVAATSKFVELFEKKRMARKQERERQLAIQKRLENPRIFVSDKKENEELANMEGEKILKEEDLSSRKSTDINEFTKRVSGDASLTINAEFSGASPGNAVEDGGSGTPTGSSIDNHEDASEIVSSTVSTGEDTLNANENHHLRGPLASTDVIESPADEQLNEEESHILLNEPKVVKSSIVLESLDSTPVVSASEDSTPHHKDSSSIEVKDTDDSELDRDNFEMGDTRWPSTSGENIDNYQSPVDAQPIAQESWMEKNFQEFDPVLQKIRAGFRENYMVAREKVQEELNLTPELSQLGSDADDGDLDWMKDDSLREIVFQVRENELTGRDPFYMMDADDKRAFFEGLEKKVEKQNAELSKIHEYIHSRVENLDYGADGISVHDPPEKFIPRWKGPPVDKNPEFLNNYVQENKEFLSESMGMPSAVNKDTQDTLEKSIKLPVKNGTSSAADNLRETPQQGTSFNPKTVIESSDGSRRAGKKSGKEYWQHTKRWSQGFLDSYNAETDPEVKAVMKGMGKDLDRWITEKEIKETAELMTKIPEKRRIAIEKKLDKLKKEMEYFGPQAVVSKYREYGEEKEEDYLWWLDLPYVLCIELYREEDGVQKAGFYTLEMAEDLKLDPKQLHVIAFEDPKDSKNFCYIIQAHMEMLGNGTAFVVARPPKDAFRDAKANGFSVTVIRKGELSLNVDQPLEEVEEQISEIGSKIYHDKIMSERSVNIHSLMKGVFGSRNPSQRRRGSKRTLEKPNES
ncbi:hypothetical protein MKX03_006732 [Papaver bracteatum]|nr:hypothetical protein MKX03_006732 [Papaver bracteatum]